MIVPLRAQRWFALAWLAWVMYAAVRRLHHAFPQPDAPLNGDAFWTYLPNARKLLEHPWAFLTTDPASYHVAPWGYVWAALWGADPVRIQWANCALFLACVLLMWRCSTRLGGLWAGVLATALLVHFPNIAAYIPQVLTETPYLFALMLATTAAIEYALGSRWPRSMLALASVGLTLTLLTRPVLQVFTVLALAAVLVWLAWRRWRSTCAVAAPARISFGVALALCAALVLPAAVAVKNGLCFGVWGLGTGAGTGLYYGVSPFKMGLEPVFTGFNYDAGLTPLTADSQTRGHPLSKPADAINAKVALSIVRNTGWADNVGFFARKLRAWLLYSTPELSMYPKLRSARSFEWLAICLAGASLLWRTRRSTRALLPGTRVPDNVKITVLAGLLLLVLAMAAQLTPVLYNTRYNLFFLEPWLILLTGVAVAVLLQWQPCASRSAALAQGALKLGAAALLVWLPAALTGYALQHETLRIDPYRPGPVAVLIDRDQMGPAQMRGATELAPGQWRTTTKPAVLQVPLHVPDPERLGPARVMDAIWRLRFALATPPGAPNCTKVLLQVSNAHTSTEWYTPETALRPVGDDALHTYAFHGNGSLRPAGDGLLALSFTCPPGTRVTWAGAELLRSTLPEAARALIQDGTPIDPYWRHEPR